MEHSPEELINGNKIFRRLNAYWNGLARSVDGMPDPGSFELDMLGPILPYLAVTEYDRAANRFRFVYFGQTLQDRFRYRIDDGYLDEAHSEEIRSDFQDHLRSVFETKLPVIRAAEMKNPNERFCRYECFTLPIADDKGGISLLVTAVTYAPCRHTVRRAA